MKNTSPLQWMIYLRNFYISGMESFRILRKCTKLSLSAPLFWIALADRKYEHDWDHSSSQRRRKL